MQGNLLGGLKSLEMEESTMTICTGKLEDPVVAVPKKMKVMEPGKLRMQHQLKVDSPEAHCTDNDLDLP